MITVAHMMRSYLGQSETFIWQYLRKFQHVYPLVIADFLENLEQFPLPNGKVMTAYWRRLSRSWFLDNWYRRILNRPFGYLESILRNRCVSLVHAHFGFVGCKYLDICETLKLPLVTTFYGHDLSNRNVIALHRKAYDNLFRKGEHFLVEGPSMKEKLIGLGCPEEKISIQRIAVDLDKYAFRERSWDGRRIVRLLFVGRFVEKKGLENAIRALAKLGKGYPFQFRIIGYGHLERKLRQIADNLGSAEKIVWLGPQPFTSVLRELHTCDILIQPSITAKNGDSEGGAPTIILEAQACGMPVISTSHADIPYVTVPNKSALLSPERDTDRLAEDIRHIFENAASWPKTGKTGRKHIEKYHDVVKEVSALEDIYNGILKRRMVL